ncbi:hypothetical protein KK423_04505 [Clostridioides difficile]|nr:hypothetical protein [Clostridioides difficile]
MKWYTWLTIILIILVSIPLKIKFIKWWDRRQKEKIMKEAMIDDKSRRVEIFLWKR